MPANYNSNITSISGQNQRSVMESSKPSRTPSPTTSDDNDNSDLNIVMGALLPPSSSATGGSPPRKLSVSDAPTGVRRPSRRGLMSKAKSTSLLFSSNKSGGSQGGEDDDDDSSSSEDSNLSGAATSNNSTVPKRWNPGIGLDKLKKSSGLFKSFSRKKSSMGMDNNHSSHPTRLSNLQEEDDTGDKIRRNSAHDGALTELIRASSGDVKMSTADVKRLISGKMDDADDLSPHGNGASSLSDHKAGRKERASSEPPLPALSTTELDDVVGDVQWNSASMLESLGDSPSSHALDNVAAVRAKEYIEECLSANVSVLDRKKWDAIPQFAKMDLVVGTHLGKGSFSDAFEVFATIVEEEASPTLASLDSDRADLDKLMEAKFKGKRDMDSEIDAMFNDSQASFPPFSMAEEEEDDLDNEIDAMFGKKEENGGDLDNEIDAMFDKKEESEDDLDNEIDAMFGKKEESEDDLDNEINAMFGKKEESEDDLDSEIDAMFGKKEESGDSMDKEIDAMFSHAPAVKQPAEEEAAKPRTVKPRKNFRRRATDLSGSVCLGTQNRVSSKPKERKVVLAMKCLRPQIRSDAEQFMIGVEDLVHETAMLASLDHPHIVKIHGRASGGCVSNSFRLSDGFFILLDRLKDTLDDRIQRWSKTSTDKKIPAISQIKTAIAIADAMSYLHSKDIIFRDLKPANVGFDSMGMLKLFDFGFAVGIKGPRRTSSSCSSVGSGRSMDDQETGLLYDRCGTPRYMAPEVGLDMGYSLPADVYSFGILLWEICALKKPFSSVKSSDEFHKLVFEKGTRPKLGKHWSVDLKTLITSCWSISEIDRPLMPYVRSMLTAYGKEISIQKNTSKKHGLRNSLVFRRSTQ